MAEERRTAGTHPFGAIFWAAFGAYRAFNLIYGLFIAEAATNSALVPILPLLAVARCWLSSQEARKAPAR